MAACCCSCLVRNPFSWLAAVGSLLAFAHSTGFGGLTVFLTSSALVLCPVILCRLKPCDQKSTRREESLQASSTAEVLSDLSCQEVTDVATQSNKNRHENVAENDAAKMEDEEASKFKTKQKEVITGVEYLVRSSPEEVLLSDSESLDQTTSSDDYSENESMFRENLSHSTNYSDGSISDEESLIEIALPTGHYVDSKRSHQEPSWYGFQQKWPDCSLQSHFRQQNWMEMLNEMNEENFIEIDLCMGSIKCSRFEIQA